MRFRLIRPLGALTLGVLGALSCSDSSGPASGTGKLTLLMKAAPGDVSITAGVVTISQISLQGSAGTLVLRDTPITTDLLTLSADVATLVQGAVIPAGHYSQLRFVISGAYLEVENAGGPVSIYASSPTYEGLPQGVSATGSLQMPSFSQSGLKVILPGNGLTISDAVEETLVLEFDVSQSFGHQAGNSGQWVMHPVIKATSVSLTGGALVTLAFAGDALPQGTMPGEFKATITGSDAVDRTADFSDHGDGTFEASFHFLTPGAYSVLITVPPTITDFTIDPTLPGTLTVPFGGTGSAAFTLTIGTPQST